MKELTTQTGIIVKCSKTAIEFFQNAQSVDFFSALEIPKEFQDIAVEFYDLILENDHPTALLGCRGNYDIAVQIDEVTGTMTGWHWFKWGKWNDRVHQTLLGGRTGWRASGHPL
ncbi:MAG: S6 modification enzyme RimK [Flavonifractor plautii]|nr:MAG: S6 modification enzyme RimK [Flavonifractor plautii]